MVPQTCRFIGVVERVFHLTTLRKQLILAALGVPTQQNDVELDVDLDMSGNDIVNLFQATPAVVNTGRIGSSSLYYNSIYGNVHYFQMLRAFTTSNFIRAPTSNLATYYIAFQSGLTSLTCAILKQGWLDILRAGDFVHLTGAAHHTLPDTRHAAPNAGDCRYDAGTDTFEIYDGAAWHAH